MKSTKELLERITSICQDSHKGYKLAADNMEDDNLKTIFNRLAQQRLLFIEELKDDARTLGLSLDDDSSVKGYFHRVWIDVKDFFSINEDQAVIEEAIRGENEAKETYEEVLKEDLPAFIKIRLEKQNLLIDGALTNLKEFSKETAKML